MLAVVDGCGSYGSSCCSVGSCDYETVVRQSNSRLALCIVKADVDMKWGGGVVRPQSKIRVQLTKLSYSIV